MPIKTLTSRIVLVAVIAAAAGVAAGAAPAAGSQAKVRPAATECATVTVKAIPSLNTAMIPEKIKSIVASCASATETVILEQTVTFTGDAAAAPSAKTWTITLTSGQSVTKFRFYPYTCCGGYKVTDRVNSTSGMQLSTSTSNWTFA